MTKVSPKGFTLVELMVVLAIIAAAFAIVWPRMPQFAAAEKSQALRKLAWSQEVLFEHAALKKKA